MVNMLIKNKKLAIVASILTFIGASLLFTSIIMYFAKIPLSGLWEGQNQLYFFTGILIAGGLATMVYGRGGTEKSAQAVRIINEALGIEVDRKDMWRILRAVEQMPPFAIKKYVSGNIDAIEWFEDQILDYKGKLSDENILKIKKVVDTPVDDLQRTLEMLYDETKLEQFKILSEPEARELIELNIREFKKVFFKE